MSDNEGWATTAKITITRTMKTTNPVLNWITAAADEDDDLLIINRTLVDENYGDHGEDDDNEDD